MQGNILLYSGAVVAICLATFFSIISPLVLKFTIDSIIGSHPMEIPVWIENIIKYLGGRESLLANLWLVGLVLVGLTLLRGVFLFLKGKWSADAAESTAQNIREKLYDHLQHLPYDYHVKSKTGDLIQRCSSDVDMIRKFLAIQFVEIGRSVFMLIFTAYIMFTLSVKMTLIAMAIIPLIFIFAVVFFLKIKQVFKLSDEAEAEMSTVLQENLTGVRVVRAFARQKFEIEKFEKKNSNYRDITYKLIRLLAAYWAISDLFCMAQIGAVLIVGSYFAANNLLTLGTLVVFITYEGMLLWPVRQMGRILADMGKAFVSLERIQEILDETPEKTSTDKIKAKITGDIIFKNVSFSYDNENPVLNDISFTVQAGQTVAILGATGSGKSSLVHLLAGLYDYRKGSITIGGHEVKEIDKKWLRRNVGLILQEPFLFAKTIKENISLAKKEADEAEVFESARTAAIHDVILEFDNGYQTFVGEKGVSLSGGQKQRIAIARTLINDCPILIFDDSLSAVDTETDATIRQQLKTIKSETTTFIISHRINTLAEADFILVMENGKIVQKGKHQQLIEEPGMYKRVWEAQSMLYAEMNDKRGINNAKI